MMCSAVQPWCIASVCSAAAATSSPQLPLCTPVLCVDTAQIDPLNTSLQLVPRLDLQVGVMFGNPETTAGGNALKFYASQRVDVRAKEKVKSGDGKVETGIRVKAKVVKNKVAPPYRWVCGSAGEYSPMVHR